MGLCHRPVGTCSLLGLLYPVSRGPDSSWDSRRAFHKCPPNELDCRVPSDRGFSIIHHSVVNLGPSTPRMSGHRLHRSRTSHLSSSRSYWTILGSRKRRFPNKISNPFSGSLTFVIIWSTRSFVCIISMNASCLARLF